MWSVINKYAQLTSLTYFNKGDVYKLSSLFGYSVSVIESENDYIFIGESKDTNLICIRGSDSVNDWIDNLKFSKRKLSKEELPIHQGFKDRTEHIIELLLPYLNNLNNGKKIIICGHSLGASISILLSDYLRKSIENAEIDVITFACPMIGKSQWNSHMIELLNNNKINIYNVLNRFDPIIGLPSKILGWRRPGKSIYLNDFTILGFIKSYFNLIFGKYSPHEMDEYLRLVQNKLDI